MKLVLSWMREFAAVEAEADEVAKRLAGAGFEVAEVVSSPEPVIDFEITANRPDCLSVAGLAREASVAFGVPFRPNPNPNSSNPSNPNPSNRANLSTVSVTLDAPDLCPRYVAQVARVKIGPSPSWLADRLHAAGVRPINNVVDVTNYVMLERGHPMHAFDLEKLSGREIVVRRARPGERLKTLDGVDRTLDPDMLVIADRERASAVAGVMGGADSEVSFATVLVAFESAYFTPPTVRRTSRRLGLKSEASARFERGADIEAPVSALARAMALLGQIGAGEPASPVVDKYPTPAERRRLTLRASRIAHVLGAAVPEADVERILTGLGFVVAHRTPGAASAAQWKVIVPSWRVDVLREIDLIEEVARHYGYDRLPMHFPELRELSPAPDARLERDDLARRMLIAAGFDEAVTFTFVERRAAEAFGDGALAAIANPLSETFAVLRPSLLPGLVEALAHNRRRQQPDVRLFETGSCFNTAQGERRRVGFVWMGRAAVEHWSQPSRGVDFFDARGVIERFAEAFGATVEFAPAERPGFVPGRTAVVRGPASGALGVLGQLQPALLAACDVPAAEAVYAAELDLEALASTARGEIRVEPLPRFPSIGRDLSILVPDGLPAADVRGTIRSAAPPTLATLGEFDRYQGKGIPEGRVSLSYHFTFRAADRTLTDAEVDDAMARIVKALEDQHGASRR